MATVLDTMISLRVSNFDAKVLDRLAEHHNCSRSDLIRAAVRDLLRSDSQIFGDPLLTARGRTCYRRNRVDRLQQGVNT